MDEPSPDRIVMDEDRFITTAEATVMARGEQLPVANERLLVYDRDKKRCFWMRPAQNGGRYKLRESPLQSSILHGARSGTDHFKPLHPRPRIARATKACRRPKRDTRNYARKKRRSAS